MLSRDPPRFAAAPRSDTGQRETEQGKDACRSQVRHDMRVIGQATKKMISGNVDAQARCDASVSDSMRRVSATRDTIERSRRRLAGHTFYVA